jgi:uncharacterized zinc-type alcohol dehydrogenase-like protein
MIHAYAAHEPKGELRPFDYDPGELAPDQVEIDVAHCGICHSDLSVIDSDWGPMPYPIVAGHEVVGTIAAVGEQVKNVAVGETVGLGWHAGYCNACVPCTTGDKNLCQNSQATIIGHYGGFADKVRATWDSVVPIPEGIDLATAGPLFCGGITVFNPLVQFDVKPTERVAVIGIGGLGHLALQFLNAWGCDVTAFTSSEAKKKEARTLGAHDTLDSTNEREIESAAERFDLILSTVNVKLGWNLYLKTLRPKGRLHFVGAALEPLEIPAMSLIGAQFSISGSPVGSPATMSQMLEFAKLHQIKPVAEDYGFDQINDAIARLRSGKAHYRIVLHR